MGTRKGICTQIRSTFPVPVPSLHFNFDLSDTPPDVSEHNLEITGFGAEHIQFLPGVETRHETHFGPVEARITVPGSAPTGHAFFVGPVPSRTLTTEAMKPLAYFLTKRHGPHPLHVESIALIRPQGPASQFSRLRIFSMKYSFLGIPFWIIWTTPFLSMR